jgi:ribulose-5-phosphate 4-epimerase/fuculose-1-phosphate aldolase
MSYDELKYNVAVATRILADLGLATGMSNSVGHVSQRVPDDPNLFIVKGRGYKMDVVGRMTPDDMVVVDLEGNKVEGPAGISQCYEIKMHSCIYRARPDVQSVVHVHPRFTILMSVLGKTLRPMSNSGGQLVRKPIPIYPHNKLILTDEDGTGVATTLADGRAVLLKGHGAATVGNTMQESVTAMLHLEEQAILNTYASGISGLDHAFMSDEMLEEARNQPTYEQLPHFRNSYDPTRSTPNGFWAFHVEQAERSLKKQLKKAKKK